MKDPLLINTLRAYIDAENPIALRDYSASLHPADLADSLDELTPKDASYVLETLFSHQSAEVLGQLDSDLQMDIVLRMSDPRLADIITNMFSDERVDLIQLLPEERRQNVLRLLARAEREDIIRLGAYEEGTAGAIMTSDYAVLKPTLTTRQALDKLRLEAPDKETIYYAYVIDEQRRLLGLISLRDLIMATPERKVEEIMRRDPVRANVADDQEDVAKTMAKYDILALPVTNGNDALVGIITFDDVHDVIEEEASEDFHRMGSIAEGFGPSASDLSGFKPADIYYLFLKRVPWLLALVFVNIFSGAGIAFFEDTIQAVVSLVFFLPLLIGSGGNAGSQSATLMVRALATGEVHMKDWFKLLGREIIIALAIGLCMGFAVSLIGIFRVGPDVTVVVALSMITIVLMGCLMGMSLPFLLTRLKLDPATASAPLIASLADIAGIVIYFGIATWYLGLQY
ncbi:magnesium transporter [Desulfonatronum thiosulfatophilum]|uniref:Magnesium transporter MgtE n=1 Tax=Desulfonatronum thiosulfatophilum TaxID=617002 RepID=A0A1G6DNW1_9BACT|nr:magnesium transporter [Desulfonatronum thiosulfatophilum]SDB46806.1 magnesium transporter [Desulfonatronum thiosulfatophilum]